MNTLKTIVIILAAFYFTACSSVPRTKHTDKSMRVMIDPDSIDSKNYVRIQQALIATQRFIVVDRAAGYRAVKKEQERLHRNEVDRFDDREKFAHWSKLYGVGAVITAHSQCQRKRSYFGKQIYIHCQQSIAIINANTGVVIAGAEDESNGDLGEQNIAPSWADVVEKMIDNYPSHFEANKDREILHQYRDLSKERALRQKVSK